MLNEIFDNIILEKWKPKNGKKLAACKKSIKSRSKQWSSAHTSAQIMKCYYNEGREMSFLKQLLEKRASKSDCGCDKKKMITEAMHRSIIKHGRPRKKSARRGSPWFRHKHTGAIIKRNDKEGRSYANSTQMAEKERLGRPVATKNKHRLKSPAKHGPAKTVEEVVWATAMKRAQGKKTNRKTSTKKKIGGKTKFQKKIEKKSSIAKNKADSIRAAHAKMMAQRSR